MKIILGSKSPRRSELLRQMGIEFEVITLDTDESFPEDLPTGEIPLFVAQKKAIAINALLKQDQLLICADTLVHCDGKVLEKPTDEKDAMHMLTFLADRWHTVTTGVCIVYKDEYTSFSVDTKVKFGSLSQEQKQYYIDQFQPYDKAGSYGIQEWIGLVGVEKINGSYQNVVGLPTFELYQALETIKGSI